VFKNRFLRTIFGPKRDEVTGEWKKLHSVSYFVLIPRYHYADQISENEVGGACGTHGRGEKSVQDFGGNTRKNEAWMGGWDQKEY
jgi:hypothetical protein